MQMPLSSLLIDALSAQGYRVSESPPIPGKSGTSYTVSLLARRGEDRFIVDVLPSRPVSPMDVEALKLIVHDTGVRGALLFALKGLTEEVRFQAPSDLVEVWDRPAFEQAIGAAMVQRALGSMDAPHVEPAPPPVAPPPSPVPELLTPPDAAETPIVEVEAGPAHSKPVHPKAPKTLTSSEEAEWLPSKPRAQHPAAGPRAPVAPPAARVPPPAPEAAPVAPQPAPSPPPVPQGGLASAPDNEGVWLHTKPRTPAPTQARLDPEPARVVTQPVPAPAGAGFLSGRCLPPRVDENEARRRAEPTIFTVREARLELLPFHVFRYDCQLEGGKATREKRGEVWVSAQSGTAVHGPEIELVDELAVPFTKLRGDIRLDVAQGSATKFLKDTLTVKENLRKDHAETSFYERVTFSPKPGTLHVDPAGTAYAPRWRVEGQNGTVFVDALSGDVIRP